MFRIKLTHVALLLASLAMAGCVAAAAVAPLATTAVPPVNINIHTGGSASVGNDGPAPLINGKPAWVYKPAKNGKIGGVGVSGFHIRGKTAQRELAITRAIDDIARQMGITVQSNLETASTASSSGAVSSAMQTYSLHTVSGTVVKAHIEEVWEDPSTQELYVWMVVE